MKAFKWILGVATVILIIFLTVSKPQRETPVAYDPATETTIKGVVYEVREQYSPVTDDQGVEIKLQTDTGPITVHMAVGRYMRLHGFKFIVGDQLEVVGSKIHFKGEDAILARQVIRRGNEQFIFRDAKGKPVWQN